jgi:small-conductance mechanosensitive channel
MPPASKFARGRRPTYASRLAALWLWLLLMPAAFAQEPPSDAAPVEVDGELLFRVRGFEARPAVDRAAAIEANIEELAAEPSFNPDTVQTREAGPLIQILGGTRAIMAVSDPDADLVGIDRTLVAAVYAERIKTAIIDYRKSRSGDSLIAGALRAGAAIGGAVVLLVSLLWAIGRVEAALLRLFERRTSALPDASKRVLQAGKLWETTHNMLDLLRAAIVLSVALFVLEYVLAQFPWTRAAGRHLFQSVAGPIIGLGQAFVTSIPDLIVLAIIFFLTRHLLWLARLYFDAVHVGRIRMRGFEQDWARPTYNLVRMGAIVAAIVIAYPFVPGSNSEAFKGLSILAGVLFSLGSSTAIANIFAGYMLIYRRSFRVGDRVKIDGIIGVVTELGLQVTHVRTIWNEEVTIPNSKILAAEVLNYSQPAREGRLILHAEVGIGYETPWRQVEAMLIEAAQRTQGLLATPLPYVLQRNLGEFAVAYQINAYTDRVDGFHLITAELNRHILDAFNEYGVQIMTPAYEGDPEAPKIVPKDQWFSAPAEPKQK